MQKNGEPMPENRRSMQEAQAGPARESSPLRAGSAVLGAFIGIRKRSSAEAAHLQIRPAHVVVAGIIGALLFIAILVTLVRFIIAR